MIHSGASVRQIDWDDLRLFLLFIRGGSTRAAADSLGVSHSTVARRLDALGVRVGTQLFKRISGRVEMTQTGQDVFETAVAIEEQLISLDRRAFGMNRDLAGTVTLSAGDVLSVPPFLEVLEDFRLSHPKVDLRLITSASLSDLDRRDADLALRFGDSPDEHLVGRRLTQTARAIYASKSYLERTERDPNGQHAGWISFSPAGSRESWKKSTPFAKLKTNLRSSDMRTQQVACRAGTGLALLPCVLCDPAPGLLRITDPEFVPRQDLWLLRHADTRNNARVRALSEHLAQAVTAMSGLLRGETAETYRSWITDL